MNLGKRFLGGDGPPWLAVFASAFIGDRRPPWYDIAVGPDFERGELRGHARGVVAIGDIASGVFALGGLARGVVALGGLSLGLVSFGGLSVGLLAAIGGLAIGGLALGGGRSAEWPWGAARGYFACGGAAIGAHATSPVRRDAAAEAFFADTGSGLCGNRSEGDSRHIV